MCNSTSDLLDLITNFLCRKICLRQQLGIFIKHVFQFLFKWKLEILSFLVFQFIKLKAIFPVRNGAKFPMRLLVQLSTNGKKSRLAETAANLFTNIQETFNSC